MGGFLKNVKRIFKVTKGSVNPLLGLVIVNNQCVLSIYLHLSTG